MHVDPAVRLDRVELAVVGERDVAKVRHEPAMGAGARGEAGRPRASWSSLVGWLSFAFASPPLKIRTVYVSQRRWSSGTTPCMEPARVARRRAVGVESGNLGAGRKERAAEGSESESARERERGGEGARESERERERGARERDRARTRDARRVVAEEAVEAALRRHVRLGVVANVPLADRLRVVARRVVQPLGQQLEPARGEVACVA